MRDDDDSSSDNGREMDDKYEDNSIGNHNGLKKKKKFKAF